MHRTSHSIRFQEQLPRNTREFAESCIQSFLNAADPYPSLQRTLSTSPPPGPTHILATGKASIAMTHAALEYLGDHFVRATVIAPQALCAQNQFKDKFVELLPGNHPLPSQESIQSTQRLLEHARSIPHDHHVLALLSGGTSAMLCSPRDTSSLEEIRTITTTALQRGASIAELNHLRSPLDQVKAGGLATLLPNAAMTKTYVLSDVVGNDFSTLGSGPFVHPQIDHTIIASYESLIDSAIGILKKQGIRLACPAWTMTGFAQEEAMNAVHQLLRSKFNKLQSQEPKAICMAGEPTVNTHGISGVGGPMSELACSIAFELHTNLSKQDSWTVLCFASDGVDGPTNTAGAIITNSMITPAIATDLHRSLQHHNTAELCKQIGASIITGPTGTNINDVAIVIHW